MSETEIAPEVLFERHNDRFMRSFMVTYEGGQRNQFNIEIKDFHDGNQDWWLNAEQAKLLADVILRKVEALELEKLPPPKSQSA